MKKIFLALMAVAAIALTGCSVVEGPGIIKVGVADETPTGLQQGNFIGSPLRYFTGIANYFVKNKNCFMSQNTYTYCECYSKDPYTARAWARVVKATVPDAVAAVEAEIKQEYPYADSKTITIRVLYYISENEKNPEVYDVQVPVDYHTDPQH